jgi:hypothetical protein
MNHRTKQVLTAFGVGFAGGFVLLLCVLIFVGIASTDSIAINPPLFFVVGLLPSALVVAAVSLFVSIAGASSAMSAFEAFKDRLWNNSSTEFSYYLHLFSMVFYPLLLAVTTGSIAFVAKGGLVAVAVSIAANLLFGFLFVTIRRNIRMSDLKQLWKLVVEKTKRSPRYKHPHNA